MLCLSYQNTFRIPLVIARPENNYGESQGDEKAIPVFIKHILHGEGVPIYGDGLHKRCWIYVKDTCAAIEGLSTAPEGIYNIGAKNELTNIALLEKLSKILNRPFNPKFIPDNIARPGHDRRYGIQPTIKVSSEWKLEQTVMWYKKKYLAH